MCEPLFGNEHFLRIHLESQNEKWNRKILKIWKCWRGAKKETCLERVSRTTSWTDNCLWHTREWVRSPTQISRDWSWRIGNVRALRPRRHGSAARVDIDLRPSPAGFSGQVAPRHRLDMIFRYIKYEKEFSSRKRCKFYIC